MLGPPPHGRLISIAARDMQPSRVAPNTAPASRVLPIHVAASKHQTIVQLANAALNRALTVTALALPALMASVQGASGPLVASGWAGSTRAAQPSVRARRAESYVGAHLPQPSMKI